MFCILVFNPFTRDMISLALNIVLILFISIQEGNHLFSKWIKKA